MYLILVCANCLLPFQMWCKPSLYIDTSYLVLKTLLNTVYLNYNITTGHPDRCHNSVLLFFSFMTYHRILNKSSTMCANSEAGYQSSWVSSYFCIAQSLAFYVVFCRTYFVALFFLALVIVLSVFLRFTAFDYHFGILPLLFLHTVILVYIYCMWPMSSI